jgi:TfoX/Sxy family transcriptional regulator of competence genes
MEMNKDYIIFNLRAALEKLEQTVKEVQEDPEYGEKKFMVAMKYAYRHMNTAWNARNCTEQAAQQCTMEDSHRWRQFPGDIDLSR